VLAHPPEPDIRRQTHGQLDDVAENYTPVIS
jgi:hypothetical protein